MDAGLLFFGLVWALLGGGRTTPETSPPARQLPAPSGGGGPLVSTPPWPQVTPSGLPRFPGPGWEFDEPPPAAVQQRARALVTPLWARGAGASKIEQTAGRWIAYQAQIVASGKKGVVAYRERRRELPPAPPEAVRRAPPSRTASSPPAAGQPASYPPGAVHPGHAQTQSPPPGAPRVAPVSTMSLPTLTYGMGLKPQAPVPDVIVLQQRLRHHGFKLDADGRFGQATRVAVIEFQRRTGLAPNQPNAVLQQRGFGAVKAATWAKLFNERA